MLLLNHLLTPTTFLVTLLYLSHLTTAWLFYTYDDDACHDSNPPSVSNDPDTFGEVGVGSVCIEQGGNSWGISDSSGCKFTSWSGRNCQGSSSQATSQRKCWSVPFGSIYVDCS